MFKDTLNFSLPMLPNLLAAWILNLSDRLFIEKYFNLGDVGIYSFGYKIASVVSVIAGSFFCAYAPLFYKIANTKDTETAKRSLKTYNNVFITVIILLTFIIIMFSHEIVIIIGNSNYLKAYVIIPLFAISNMISQIAGLFNLSIYQVKKSIIVMYIMLISSFSSIALNFILVPQYAIYGAAISSVISMIIMWALGYFSAKMLFY